MEDNSGNRSLAKNAVFNVFYRLLNILFPLISSGYVARVLMSEGVGRNASAVNNVSYFVLLGSLGIQAYATREIARRRNNKKATDGFFSEMLVVNAVLTTAAVISFVICLSVVDLFKSEQTLYFICGFAILENYVNIDWYFQGTEDFKYIAVRSFIIKVLGLLAVFAFIRSSDDVYKFAIISVYVDGVYHLINIIHASKTVRFSLRNIHLKQHLRSLIFLALCTVSTELYARMDITMLGIIKDQPTVACYTYAQKVINLIIISVIAITGVFLPRLSFYYSNDNKRFNKLTKFGADLMIFFSIPICLGIVSVAYPLITLWLGDEYGQAAPCLVILAFMIPLKCIGDIVCYQVMMCAGQEFCLMIAYAVTMLINLINNLLLIPRYGALGAAIASLISEVIVFAIVIVVSRKYQHYSLDKWNLIVVTLSSLIMLGCVLLFESMFGNVAVKLFGGAAVGAAVFAALNIVCKNSFFTSELPSAVFARRSSGSSHD